MLRTNEMRPKSEASFPIWDELRRGCPIAHTDRYQGAYLPTRYEDVRAIPPRHRARGAA
jgi:hypothetical protein